jgi:DNA invertase Pin-like site-specific DNA recombinase
MAMTNHPKPPFAVFPREHKQEGVSKMSENTYTADIYLRLSREDEDKEESDSIGNQRSLILDYLKTQPDIKLHKIKIDDGQSGVDFNRPAFMEMLDDIKEGLVNCVIVKDFSRFGRNYIESGKYIQVIFPHSGVRFIAVNENYDSLTVQGYTGNIIVPFKNMINDAYCADISVKVRSHLDIKRKRGDFVGAFAVYGYAKDENNHNKLVIDSFAADVVRDIYKLKLEGISAQGIANKLNQSGILSPMEYKRFIGLRYNTTFKVHATAQWQSCTVKRILTNAIYTGVLEQGKRTKPNYKVRKCAEVPREQWICLENAHDPIIDRSIFATVQELLKQDTRAVKSGSSVFPLAGIIICGDCGGAMVRKTNSHNGKRYPYYVCGKHRTNTSVCSTHIISATECENAVLNTLRIHTAAVLDMEKALACADSMAYRQEGVRKLTARLEAKQEEIKKHNDYRLSLYESYHEGIIGQEDFKVFKLSYDEKLAAAEASAQQLKEDIEKLVTDVTENHDWIDKFRDYAKVETLERKTVAELIESVTVYEGSRVAVKFRYYNEFMRLIAAKEAA